MTGCLAANDWICPEYVTSRAGELADATAQHLWITGVSVLLGLAVAFPLALLVRARPGFAGPVLGLTTVLYAVPSLAMFSLLLPVFGLSAALVVTGLVLYSLTILVRNTLAGLAAVPAETREAARGMGYGTGRLLWEVELPLALPAVLAGVRMATVSTVALTTVGALVDYGGLGTLITDGLRSFFKAQVLTASVLCVLLAVTADVLLLGVQRLLTPWTRATRRRAPAPAREGRPGGGPRPEGGSRQRGGGWPGGGPPPRGGAGESGAGGLGGGGESGAGGLGGRGLGGGGLGAGGLGGVGKGG
ncbi:ABC transporter permease [Streptomyces rubrolavendulae]|uniref:Carnitine transport permease protein OpuCB n=1 Tax=Streptomyces rubrolavendulae TaxID=285473 RepID=A0A1D8G493_9ACTN|nr:ABC transporter permease [Streptomyces rubrolavendulae]AOT60244.1 Carnitine transport permease protein OpuCB [Streptomyces rubrolavendulae]